MAGTKLAGVSSSVVRGVTRLRTAGSGSVSKRGVSSLKVASAAGLSKKGRFRGKVFGRKRKVSAGATVGTEVSR
jgi:hypothetical protein